MEGRKRERERGGGGGRREYRDYGEEKECFDLVHSSKIQAGKAGRQAVSVSRTETFVKSSLVSASLTHSLTRSLPLSLPFPFVLPSFPLPTHSKVPTKAKTEGRKEGRRLVGVADADAPL